MLVDTNPELINCYVTLRDDPAKLITALRKHVNKEDYFYKVRAQKSEDLDSVERAARLIYLNKTCFNGLYRVNKEGRFNVPFGKRVNPSICEEKKLLGANRALQGVQIVCDSYDKVVRAVAKAGDFGIRPAKTSGGRIKFR